jgi:hypothetical protein
MGETTEERGLAFRGGVAGRVVDGDSVGEWMALTFLLLPSGFRRGGGAMDWTKREVLSVSGQPIVQKEKAVWCLKASSWVPSNPWHPLATWSAVVQAHSGIIVGLTLGSVGYWAVHWLVIPKTRNPCPAIMPSTRKAPKFRRVGERQA